MFWDVSEREPSYNFSAYLSQFSYILGFPRDRKELILQYLSGLASNACSRDQQVVRDFLAGLGSTEKKDALVYLQQVQKMKGEWYNQQGKF